MNGRAAFAALRDARADPDRWACLMFHELAVPGRPLVDADSYAIDASTFREALGMLAAGDIRGVSVGEAVARGRNSFVAITFDDGFETDVTEAAPALASYGFGATFYIVCDYIGERGYLSTRQIRELAAAGFEIGSHSLSHSMLTVLPEEEMRRELEDSRARIEDVAGCSVRHFSCPHGRWSPAIAQAAVAVGYTSVATSRIGLNRTGRSPLALRRVAIQVGQPSASVAAVAAGSGLWRPIIKQTALDAAKRVFGERGYASLRRSAMRAAGRSSPGA